MNFSQFRGVDLQINNLFHTQSRHPFLTYKGYGNFFDDRIDKDFSTLAKGFNYFFVKKSISTAEHCYLCEPNLIAIFTQPQKIFIDYSILVSKELLESVKQNFYKGYASGEMNFPSELGHSFAQFDLEYRKLYLEGIGAYCLSNLFFEGYATPECLYALGYIQACLVMACWEYEKIVNHDEFSKQKSKSVPIVKELTTLLSIPTPPIPLPAIENKVDIVKIIPRNKIEIIQRRTEIVSVWYVLQDIEAGILQSRLQRGIFKDKNAIHKILGMIFFEKSTDTLFRNTKKQKWQVSSASNMKIALQACMYITYRFNAGNGNLKLYAEVLKESFSCFDQLSESTIQTNMNKSLKNFLQILEKTDTERTRIVLALVKKNIN